GDAGIYEKEISRRPGNKPLIRRAKWPAKQALSPQLKRARITGAIITGLTPLVDLSESATSFVTQTGKPIPGSRRRSRTHGARRTTCLSSWQSYDQSRQ